MIMKDIVPIDEVDEIARDQFGCSLQLGYYAVIERDDGTCYTQHYKEFEDLQDLLRSLGPGYHLVDIFS